MAEAKPSSSTPDQYKYLQLTQNPDGTFTSANIYARTLANPEIDSELPVLTKDISINKSKNTWARIFLPKQAFDAAAAQKLPVIVYFHGGGFILCGPDESASHEFCSNMASDLSVIIVSASYRLAPQHRLPAAYDDAMEALYWIKTSHDEKWLQNHADFSKIFLMGGSAGANIAYQLGLTAADHNLLPLKIKGLILHQPFFGGVQRTESELRSINDPAFPPSLSDLMWEFSLPIGVDRDHEYSNPTVGDVSTALEKIKGLGWRVFVTVCSGDQLIDRQIELVKIMQRKGVEVVSRVVEGGCHGLELFDPSKAKPLYVDIKNFISSSI